MTWEYEDTAAGEGYRAVCGVDEAGRGPLAGPVCAAAVILPRGLTIEGLNDSKKLTEKKREALYPVILERAVAWSAALVDEQTIDGINILQATFRAMREAVAGLAVPADFVLVDGNRSEGLAVPHRCIIGGDGLAPSIAAASVVAKVTRDRLMRQYDVAYPQYGFAKHKGYGSRVHYEALLRYGPCPLHRRTFLRKFYAAHPEAPR